MYFLPLYYTKKNNKIQQKVNIFSKFNIKKKTNKKYHFLPKQYNNIPKAATLAAVLTLCNYPHFSNNPTFSSLLTLSDFSILFVGIINTKVKGITEPIKHPEANNTF